MMSANPRWRTAANEGRQGAVSGSLRGQKSDANSAVGGIGGGVGCKEIIVSHLLDFEAVAEKLVLLQHLAHGSEQYCRERLTGSEYDAGDGALDEYWSWVKGLVSGYTLECCIRLRVLLDTVAGKPGADKIVGLDAAARSGLVIGQVVDGKFELTLREICNKIIHAQKAIPVWATGIERDVEFKYWSGDYDLSGTKGNESWRLILHVAPWAKSADRFLEKAESAELTSNVGQDWY